VITDLTIKMDGEFSEATFERKLVELRESQKEIQALSTYCIHHRAHHKMMVRVWYKNLKGLHVNRKLSAMYLVNDVVQNGRKKGPEFAREFGTVMRRVFDHLATMDFDEKTVSSLGRLVAVWQERQIFDRKVLQEVTAVWDAKRQGKTFDGGPPAKRRASSGSSGATAEAERRKSREMAEIADIDDMLESSMVASGPPVPPPAGLAEESLVLSPRQGGSPGSGDPPEPEELIKALQELENSASSDATVREKIAKLPPAVSEQAKLSSITTSQEAEVLGVQVEEASHLLDNYNLRLQEELKDRKKVGTMIAEFLSAQKDLLAQAEERLEQYQDKMDRYQGMREELNSHIASLPDIPVLPATTGLAPLPSAGDLFTH